MGSFAATSQTLIGHPVEAVYDFASNPNNWPKTYKGSHAIADQLPFPLKVGASWTEIVKLSDTFSCRSTWTLIAAERPRKWLIQQVDGIAQPLDGGPGVDGITTISYEFEPVDGSSCLFTRTLRCALLRGVRIPDELLVACAQPAGIDAYHAAITRELDKLRPNGV